MGARDWSMENRFRECAEALRDRDPAALAELEAAYDAWNWDDTMGARVRLRAAFRKFRAQEPLVDAGDPSGDAKQFRGESDSLEKDDAKEDEGQAANK